MQQPNFQNAKNLLNEAAEEFGRCSNLQAVELNQNVLGALQNIQGTLDQHTQVLAQHTQVLAQHTETLKRLEQRMDWFQARNYNSRLPSGDLDLRPLLVNGQVPPHFPQTKNEIYSMDAGEVEALLRIYQLPVNGRSPAKRNRLEQFIC